jgi:hypothetical protein
MRRIFVAFVALFTFDVVVSFAKKSEAVTLQEEAGVIVKAKPSGGSVDELFAIGEFDAAPKDVFDLLWNIPSHSKFMSPIKEATNISENTTSRIDHIIFHAILPGIKDRDVVSKTTITEKTDARIKLQFKQTDAAGPTPSKDLVRLTLREGGWDLVPIDCTLTQASRSHRSWRRPSQPRESLMCMKPSEQN